MTQKCLPILNQHENQMHDTIAHTHRVQRPTVVRIIIEHKVTRGLHQPDVGHQVGHKALHLEFHHLEQQHSTRWNFFYGDDDDVDEESVTC